MATLNWIGGAVGDWNEPSNWDSGTVPSYEDDVWIEEDYAEIYSEVDIVTRSITIGGYTVYVFCNDDVYCLDYFLMKSSGELRLNGHNLIAKTTSIEENAFVDLSGTGKIICSMFAGLLSTSFSSSGSGKLILFGDNSEIIVSFGEFAKAIIEKDVFGVTWEDMESIFDSTQRGLFIGSSVYLENVIYLPKTKFLGENFVVSVNMEKIVFDELHLLPDLSLQENTSLPISNYFNVVASEQEGEENIRVEAVIETDKLIIEGQSDALYALNSTYEVEEVWNIVQAGGVVNAKYADIEYSHASGAATFKALIRNGCVDSGNNEGWTFQDNVTFSNLTVIEKETDSAKIAVDILEYSGEQASLFTSDLRDESSTYVFIPYARKTFSIKNRKGGKQYRFYLLNTVPESETPEYIFYHDLIEGLIQGISLETDCVYFQCNSSDAGQYYDLILCEDEIEVDRIHIEIDAGT